MRGFLICFTGVDGSGKTTHSRVLMKYLENKGYSCKYIWGGSRPILAYSFFGLTRLFGYWKMTRKDAYTDPLEAAPKNVANRLTVLWRLLLFVDFQIRSLITTRFWLSMSKSVICDRYFYDILMELERADASSSKFMWILAETLPKPLVAFLLDVPETLAVQRRGFSKEELVAKRRAFLQIGRALDLVIIDASQDFAKNHERICSLTTQALMEASMQP